MAVPVATRHSFLLYQYVPYSAGDVDTQRKKGKMENSASRDLDEGVMKLSNTAGLRL